MSPLKKTIVNILLFIQLHLAICQLLPQNPYSSNLYGNRVGELCGNLNYNPYDNLFGNLYGCACDNQNCNVCGNPNSNLYGATCGTPNCNTCNNLLAGNPYVNLNGNGCENSNCITCNNACENLNRNLYGYDRYTCMPYSNGYNNLNCNLYGEACGNPTCNSCGNPYGVYGHDATAQPIIAPCSQPYWQPDPVCPQSASNQPPVIIINDEDDGNPRDCHNEELFTLLMSSAFNRNNAVGPPLPPFDYYNNGCRCGNNNNCNCNNDCNCGCCRVNDCNCGCSRGNNCNCGYCRGSVFNDICNDNNNCNNCNKCNNNRNCNPTVHITIVLPKTDKATAKPSVTVS